MTMRAKQVLFDNQFSPVERRYTDYLSANPSTVITGARQPSRGPVPAVPKAPVPLRKPKPLPALPRLPMVRPAGAKVIETRAGPMKPLVLGGKAFLIPSGTREQDVIAGVGYMALNVEPDVTFATDPSGSGLTMFDRHGRRIQERHRSPTYSWDELARLGQQFGVLPRWAWTATQPKKTLDAQKEPYSLITLHHTGRQDSPEAVMDLHHNNISARDKIARRVAAFSGQGQSYEDWDDIGYHFLIDQSGRIFEGRSLEAEGAHVGGKNPGNLGIAIVGDYSSKPMNASQLRALRFLVGVMKRRGVTPNPNATGGIDGDGFIFTHGDFTPAKHEELAGARHQLKGLTK